MVPELRFFTACMKGGGGGGKKITDRLPLLEGKKINREHVSCFVKDVSHIVAVMTFFYIQFVVWFFTMSRNHMFGCIFRIHIFDHFATA